MRHRLRSSIVVGVLLVATAAAANDLADLQASSKAMKCCKAARYRCAGLKSPDDCCKTMHGTARHAATAVPGANRPADGGATFDAVAVAASLVTFAPIHDVGRPAFKRPHDPPHLHAFSLLI